MPAKVATSTARMDVIEALLVASRAMIAIASRSLAAIDQDVTLPQSRALVLLAARGPQRVADIAGDLGVAPSTATRTCDRLARKGLLRRYRNAADRREVKVALTPTGRELAREVTRHRREELARVVDALPATAHHHVAAALQALNTAAGELPDRDWWLAPDESGAATDNAATDNAEADNAATDNAEADGATPDRAIDGATSDGRGVDDVGVGADGTASDTVGLNTIGLGNAGVDSVES